MTLILSSLLDNHIKAKAVQNSLKSILPDLSLSKKLNIEMTTSFDKSFKSSNILMNEPRSSDCLFELLEVFKILSNFFCKISICVVCHLSIAMLSFFVLTFKGLLALALQPRLM